MKRLMIAVGILWTVGSQASPQDAPAQPLAEENVVSLFEKAAPDLFIQWLPHRDPEAPLLALGRQGDPAPGCRPGSRLGSYFQFFECLDLDPPRIAAIDVKKTDSLMIPFVGTIKVRQNLRCSLRYLLATEQAWKTPGWERLKTLCEGKSYEECAAAGMEPPKKRKASALWPVCEPLPDSTTEFVNEATVLNYGWSHGRWEFQNEDKAPDPSPPAP
ncbi:MAG TPA: hypothetical protein VFG76_06765 [Candidatus Polarisedimenticolia bacterium]|nr:hypothetical protein [Candidatus Polarisedimenticolia bacterium]